MKVPTARIEENATIAKLCIRTEADEEKRLGVFAEERTKSLVINLAGFILSFRRQKPRWGTSKTRQA